MIRQDQQLLLLRRCFRRQLRKRTNGAAARSSQPPQYGTPPPTLPRSHRPHRWFMSTPTTCTYSESPLSSVNSDILLLSYQIRNRNNQHDNSRFHPTLQHRLPQHLKDFHHPPCVSLVTSSRPLPICKRWLSSFSYPSSSGFDPLGRSDPLTEQQQAQPTTTTLPPNSSIYDPRTNEPAGLRLVLDGMKRVEQQITNMEYDIIGIKQTVKKIRESNGRTENRMDSIEQLADTMQADLHASMALVRALNETLGTKRENTGRCTNDDDNEIGSSNDTVQFHQNTCERAPFRNVDVDLNDTANNRKINPSRDTIQFHHPPTIPTNTANDPQSRDSATAATLREKFRRDYAQRQKQLSDHQPMGLKLSSSQNYDNNPSRK